jgi:hypothetical protein
MSTSTARARQHRTIRSPRRSAGPSPRARRSDCEKLAADAEAVERDGRIEEIVGVKCMDILGLAVRMGELQVALHQPANILGSRIVDRDLGLVHSRTLRDPAPLAMRQKCTLGSAAAGAVNAAPRWVDRLATTRTRPERSNVVRPEGEQHGSHEQALHGVVAGGAGGERESGSEVVDSLSDVAGPVCAWSGDWPPSWAGRLGARLAICWAGVDHVLTSTGGCRDAQVRDCGGAIGSGACPGAPGCRACARSAAGSWAGRRPRGSPGKPGRGGRLQR